MSELIPVVESFRADPALTAAQTAAQLVAHLESAGFESRVVRPTQQFGLDTVWGGRHDGADQIHVLVHQGSDRASLRDLLAKFLEVGVGPARPWVLTPVDPPADVRFALSDHPLAVLERELSAESLPDMKTPIGALPERVAALRPRVEAAAGRSLGGDPVDVGASIDAIVDVLRGGADPDTQMADGSIAPMRLLVVLGLVATEAVRDAVGGGRLINLDYGGSKEIRTLGDAEGFPGIALGDSLLVNVALKVRKRWINGSEDSVRFLVQQVLKQVAETPPESLPPKESPVEHAGEPSPQELTRRALELSKYAPFAAFVLVAAADGDVAPEEFMAFVKGVADSDDALLTRMMAAESIDELKERLRRVLSDRDLVATALAAAGVMFQVPGDGPAAKAKLLEVLASVAAADGHVDAEEKDAIAAVEAMLDAGPGVFAELAARAEADDDDDDVRAAALAPHAMFLAIAAADGELEPAELEAFIVGLAGIRNPLLRRVVGSGDDAAARLKALMAEPDRAGPALRAMSRLVANDPDGPGAREELRRVLAGVVAAHGTPREKEARVLDAAMALIDQEGTVRAGIASAWLGGLLLVVAIGAWQLISAVAGLTAVFVPVAIAIQALVLAWVLWLPSGRMNYVIQVIRGTMASWLAAIPIGVLSLIVGAIFGELSLMDALAGALGTAITGPVLAALLAIFLRR